MLPVPAQTQLKDQSKTSGLADFATISAGKQKFFLHGEPKSHAVQVIRVLCDGLSSANCGKPLSRYNGLRGVLLAKRPRREDSLYLWYPVALENGEHLFMRVPRWRQLNNPFDASKYIIDQRDIDQAQAMVNERLLPSLEVSGAGYEIVSGTVFLILDRGTRLSRDIAMQRMALLNDFVATQDHGRAYILLEELELRRSGNKAWSAAPKSADNMLLYGDLILDGIKPLDIVVNHQGSDSVNFNAVEVAPVPRRGQPIYARNFEQWEIERVTGVRGGALEQARVAAAAEEQNLLATLTETPAQIILHGRYPVRGKLGQDQASELKALMDLYELIDLPLPVELADTEAASASGS